MDTRDERDDLTTAQAELAHLLDADETAEPGVYRCTACGEDVAVTDQPAHNEERHAERTVLRVPASQLRAGDEYLTTGGQFREITKVWRSRDSRLFAGSRARVETVQAHVAGSSTPKGWDLDEMLTVTRLVDQVLNEIAPSKTAS